MLGSVTFTTTASNVTTKNPSTAAARVRRAWRSVAAMPFLEVVGAVQ
jgi:hypothetical protein